MSFNLKMKENDEFLPEINYIVISKKGLNSTKNQKGSNMSQLTLKEGEQSVKINLNSSVDNKISKKNILQTITNYRKKIIQLQKNKNNKNQHFKTATKENNRKRYRKNTLIEEKNINSYNSVDAMNDINRIDKNDLSNSNNEIKTYEKNSIEEKINPEDTQIIVKNNNNSLVIENKKENANAKNEMEEHFVSSINKKSVKTLQIKKELKELQKSKQISDKAEISKVNSESDNYTEFDLKMKSSMKLKKINDNNSNYNVNGIIPGSNINEKEEFENELIENNKDIMTIIDNNDTKHGEASTKRNIDNNESIKNLNNLIIRNNYLNKNSNNIDYTSIIENSGVNDLIDKSSNKKDISNTLKNKSDNINDTNRHLKSNLIEDNISENKKLIPVIPILKKHNNKTLTDLATKEEGNDNQNKKKVSIIIKDNQKNSIPSSINNELLLSQNIIRNPPAMTQLKHMTKSLDNSQNNNKVFFSTYQSIQKDCYICEKTFFFIKLYYAECNRHFLCRKCLKSYYEEYLERKNFSKILKCPCAQCDKKIDYENVVKEIISETHQKIYENHMEDKEFNERDKDGDCTLDSNIKLYTKRHVLDVNNNKNVFMFKKTKDRYCPRCLMPYLFSKTNNNFIKCLFCNFKICKYCLKEYTSGHLNIQSEDHCKIRFRRGLDEQEQKNCFIKYLIEAFFVIVSYILLFPGTFLSLSNAFNICLCLNKKEKSVIYYIKYILGWVLCVIFFIICCPFIIIIYSIFPVIAAIFDY